MQVLTRRILTAVWLYTVATSCGGCGSNASDKNTWQKEPVQKKDDKPKKEERLEDIAPPSLFKEGAALEFIEEEESDHEESDLEISEQQVVATYSIAGENHRRKTTLLFQPSPETREGEPQPGSTGQETEITLNDQALGPTGPQTEGKLSKEYSRSTERVTIMNGQKLEPIETQAKEQSLRKRGNSAEQMTIIDDQALEQTDAQVQAEQLFEQQLQEYHRNKALPASTDFAEFKRLCKQYKSSHDLDVEVNGGKLYLSKSPIPHSGHQNLYQLCLQGIWRLSDISTREQESFVPADRFAGWRVKLSFTDEQRKTLYSIVIPINLFLPVSKKTWESYTRSINLDQVKYVEWTNPKRKLSAEMKFAPRIILLDAEASLIRKHAKGVRLRFFDAEKQERGICYTKVVRSGNSQHP